ncbi:peptidase M14 [Alteromonas sediminis]|uniref:Peptidase M14 n=1 Tax=Alteromonas sediminis TaxID=2259342 RepID=A0A3N5YAD4_9ALTE|nr:M14 family metallopeptidase [Alteromonas sediminis]RPJ68489.1 peptidase M14 [Alteromonas sediminis]
MWRLLLIAGLLSTQAYASCEFDGVTFHADYAGGKLDGCERLAPGHFMLTTKPENTPINPSPWYSFAIESDTEQRLTLSIAADGQRPRYLPQVSENGESWQPLPFTLDEHGFQVQLTIGASATRYVSANALFTSQDYIEWATQLSESSAFEQVLLGRSTGDRPIYGLVHEKPDNKEWLLVLGRQHPPELTGAFAMLSFVDALAQQEEVMPAFFNRFNVLVVPVVNPDGVDEGYWRHNLNGVDLNRDWGKFTQQETRVVHEAMQKLISGDERLVFALDFHSTRQDVFYTMPSDYGVMPADFVLNWLDAFKKESVRSFVVRDQPGSSPGRGVFKQFIADTYGVHAVTFEMGDNTPKALLDHVGKVSAHTLMEQMLQTRQQDFIFVSPDK